MSCNKSSKSTCGHNTGLVFTVPTASLFRACIRPFGRWETFEVFKADGRFKEARRLAGLSKASSLVSGDTFVQ